jgi:methionine sulfoxide reductase heme-binding subunit
MPSGALHVPLASALIHMSNISMWYLTRAFAISAYFLLALSMMLGMLRSIARTSGEHISSIVDDLHAFTMTLTALLIVGHLVTLLLHDFYHFTILNLVLPGNQPYREEAVNLGVFGLWGMVLVLGSSYLRRVIPYKLWRSLHAEAFGVFLLLTAHGILAGSDASEAWMRGVYGGVGAAVVFMGILRLLIRPKPATKQ